ncbi:MAG TPA: sigma-70 family RNA polymerase sigma factor [Candidatus Limnocylindrales bacterium]|nr:sigma-70 family RNA polymerase sigma factor [Candidatus Limnocylindrales bacterium]
MGPDLVERARAGDREAFAGLAQLHADRMFSIARRILRDFELAEDAVQEALVAAWRELPRLRDAERFEAWLTRIVVHRCYAMSKTTRARSAVRRLDPGQDVPGPDALSALHDRDELERGFRRLPIGHRAVLVLHHYVGLEPTDIAEALGIPPGTVRSRLHYAHRALRAALEADARLPIAGGPTA